MIENSQLQTKVCLSTITCAPYNRIGRKLSVQFKNIMYNRSDLNQSFFKEIRVILKPFCI